MNRMILSIAIISSLSVACGGEQETVVVSEPAPNTAEPAQNTATVADAATNSGKSDEAPKAIEGKSTAVSASGSEESAPGGFNVGSTVSCNWQNMGIYFSATIERVNGQNVSVLYSDGDREDTTISKCRLGSEGSLDGDLNAAMEELGEEWAEEFEDEMEDALEELNEALEAFDF